MKITKFSQSTFLVENQSGQRLLIDPGKYNYEDNFETKDFGRVDVLVITHKHEDHHYVSAEREIVERWQPVVITNSEIGGEEEVGSFNCVIKAPGEQFQSKDFSIDFIKTDHFAKCEIITNFGLLIRADGVSFYHTSDTRFMEPCYFDLELVKGVNALAVPISNRGVVMGLDDSIVFTSVIEPSVVIPMHFDSPKDKGRISGQDFATRFAVLVQKIPALSKTKVEVLDFNQSLQI